MKKYKSKYDFKKEPSRRRRIFFVVFVVILFFGCIEGILRLFDFGFYINFNADILGMPLLDMTRFRRITNRTVDFDPYLFWKFKPNQVLDAEGVYLKPVIINSHGFRGAEFNEKKPRNVFRIICLGDSSTFGWSVGENETYPYYLRQFLQKKYPDGRFEVLNMGITGYTSRQGRELFSRNALNLQPDMVIFAFGPNDRIPALRSDADHILDRTWAISKMQVFFNYSQVYKLIKSGVIYIENRIQGLSLDPETFIPKLVRKVNQEEFAENATVVKNLCDKIRADFLLVNVDFPSEQMDSVTDILKEQAKKSGVQLPKNWKFWDSSSVTQELANKLNVPEIDILILFSDYLELVRKGEGDRSRAEAKRKQLGKIVEKETWRYLMVDNGHPNAWGNELIAKAILEKIESSPQFITYIEEQKNK